MASHVFVIDSSARRHQIKTTPATYLRDVLEEACKRFGKDPEQFILSDNSRPPKTIDLSLTIRLSGLPNGVKLNLVQGSRSPSVVNIALKLPASLGGQRLQDKFPSTTSLWLVLRKFEEAVAGGAAQKLNVTQRAVPSTDAGSGRLEYEQPVVKIMRRELADFAGLQKTLAQLGYNSGSVLLQLDYRRSGKPVEEAMEQIQQYFQDSETSTAPTQSSSPQAAQATESAIPPTSAAGNLPAVENGGGIRSPADGHTGEMIPTALVAGTTTQRQVNQSSSTNTGHDTVMNDAPSTTERIAPEVSFTKQEPPTASEQSDLPPPSSTAELTHPSPSNISQTEATPSDSAQTPISVYKPPHSTTPLAALLPSTDADFTPTVEHAHAHQAVLNRAAQNRRLQSDAEIEAESYKRREVLSAVRSTTVRVRFPDQMQVDLTIRPDETGAGLYTTVQKMLRHEDLPFELRYTGPKGAPLILTSTGPDAARKLIADLGWKGRVLVTMVWAADVPAHKKAAPALKESLVGQAKELTLPLVPSGVASSSEGAAAGGKALGGSKPVEKKGKADLEAKMKKFLGFGKK